MRKTVVTLTGLFVILVATFPALAQETKPVEPKPVTPTAQTDSEQPKNEVERMLAEAKKRGEPIFGVCIQDCGEGENGRNGKLEAGVALALPKPVYPALARAAHVMGMVDVQVIIDEEGKVIAAAAIRGHPLLQATSVQAARNALFSPTKIEGQPVKVAGVLRYKFFSQ